MSSRNNTSYLGTLSMPQDRPGAKTMIKVDHVTMIFNIASEQLNSLKEYAIALSRRELRFKEFRALDDVSFEVKKGDVFGILGTNGSGKSTMLKIIAGVLEPSKGSCTVEGSIAPLIELGAGFDLELTARENIFLNGALLGYSKKFIQEHFEEIVEFAEVSDFLDMPMKNYSSGMVARIAFAIATVIVPDVLIVDEVLSVGDFMFQQKCERRIQSLIKEHGVTVLIVSHNNDQIERLCNKAVWIEKGHLRAIGAAREVCEVYRAIGGRPGSPEAEKRILDLLDSNSEVPEELRQCVFGETRYGVPVQLNEFADAPCGTVILTNSDREQENRIATGLAGVLDAAILASRPDKLPDVVAQEIKHKQPARIVTVGSEDSLSSELLSGIVYSDGSTPICSSIERSAEPEGVEAYRLGKEHGSWGDTAILAVPEPSFTALMLSSFAFSNRAPFFYTDAEGVPSDEVRDALNDFERIVITNGSTTSVDESSIRESAHSTEILRFEDKGAAETMDAVNSWLQNEHSSTPSTLVISSSTNSIDNHFIGSFVGRLGGELVLEDAQDLDSIAHTVSHIESRDVPPKEIVFLGSEMRFSKLDKSIIGKAAIREQI